MFLGTSSSTSTGRSGQSTVAAMCACSFQPPWSAPGTCAHVEFTGAVACASAHPEVAWSNRPMWTMSCRPPSEAASTGMA